MTPKAMPIIWDYFVRTDRSEKKALCKYCKKLLSYKTTITNLKNHLKLKHLRAFIEFRGKVNAFLGKTAESGSTEKSGALTTVVAISGDEKTMILCPHTGEQLVGETKNDSTTHQMDQDIEEVDIDQDLEVLDCDDDEEVNNQEFEEVYLSNGDCEETVDKWHMGSGADIKPIIEPTKTRAQQQKEKNYKKYKHKNKIKQISDVSSSDESIERCRHKKDENSGGYFSKYLESLLRNLPRGRAHKLQLELIRLVMKEIELFDNIKKNYSYNSSRSDGKNQWSH